MGGNSFEKGRIGIRYFFKGGLFGSDMSDVEIYHAKYGCSRMKNKEVMTVLVYHIIIIKYGIFTFKLYHSVPPGVKPQVLNAAVTMVYSPGNCSINVLVKPRVRAQVFAYAVTMVYSPGNCSI